MTCPLPIHSFFSRVLSLGAFVHSLCFWHCSFPPLPLPPRSLAPSLFSPLCPGAARVAVGTEMSAIWSNKEGLGRRLQVCKSFVDASTRPLNPVMKWWRRVCGRGFTAFIGWTGPGVGCPLSAAFTRASSAFLCLAILARAPPWTSDWRRACSREAFAFFLFFFFLPPPPRKFPGRSTTRAG